MSSIFDLDHEAIRQQANRQAEAVSWGNATRSQVYKIGLELADAVEAAEKAERLLIDWQNQADALALEVATDELLGTPDTLVNEFDVGPMVLSEVPDFLASLSEADFQRLEEKYDPSQWNATKGIFFWGIDPDLPVVRTVVGWATIPTLNPEDPPDDYCEIELMVHLYNNRGDCQ